VEGARGGDLGVGRRRDGTELKKVQTAVKLRGPGLPPRAHKGGTKGKNGGFFCGKGETRVSPLIVSCKKKGAEMVGGLRY